MTEPIIVPVSAPGATAAAAEVRQFGASVAQTGAATEKAAAGHTGLAKATTAAGNAAEGAAAKTKLHTRTLDEEYIRLKRLEEQALVTAAARRKLGESANAADIGAIRRFTRGIGGVGSEVGRGVAEGIEGAQGSGLRSTLGMGGAALAAGVLTYEGISHAVDALVESIHREIEERYKGIRLLEEADKRTADIGKGALDKYGDALASIAAGGGEASVKAAKDFSVKNKDASGIEAYDMASKHFAPGSERGLALQAAEMFHQAGGGSLKEAMGKIGPERIQRMLAGGKGMGSMVGEMFGDEHGIGRLSEDDVQQRIANRSASPTAAAIDRLRGLENQADVHDVDKIPSAEGPIRQSMADRANPRAAVLHEEDVKGREAYEKLQADAGLERGVKSGLNQTGAGQIAGYIYTAWQKIVGNGTANDRLDRASNEKFDQAEKLMPGSSKAADALEEQGNASLDAARALRALGQGASPMGATP